MKPVAWSCLSTILVAMALLVPAVNKARNAAMRTNDR
jgi:hypothetical protein